MMIAVAVQHGRKKWYAESDGIGRGLRGSRQSTRISSSWNILRQQCLKLPCLCGKDMHGTCSIWHSKMKSFSTCNAYLTTQISANTAWTIRPYLQGNGAHTNRSMEGHYQVCHTEHSGPWLHRWAQWESHSCCKSNNMHTHSSVQAMSRSLRSQDPLRQYFGRRNYAKTARGSKNPYSVDWKRDRTIAKAIWSFGAFWPRFPICTFSSNEFTILYLSCYAPGEQIRYLMLVFVIWWPLQFSVPNQRAR